MKESHPCSDITIKSVKNTANCIISGYASVFGIIDKHNDVIAPGAFKTAKEGEVKLLWQHDHLKPIGIVKMLKEDQYGLKFEAEINGKTTLGKETIELIKQKAIGGLSVGFEINNSSYDEKGIRVIDDASLIEVSVVTFPANNQAEIISVKSRFKNNKAEANIEKTNSSLAELSKLIKKLSNY